MLKIDINKAKTQMKNKVKISDITKPLIIDLKKLLLNKIKNPQNTNSIL